MDEQQLAAVQQHPLVVGLQQQLLASQGENQLLNEQVEDLQEQVEELQEQVDELQAVESDDDEDDENPLALSAALKPAFQENNATSIAHVHHGVAPTDASQNNPSSFTI